MAIFAEREGINCRTCPIGLKSVRGCLKDLPTPVSVVQLRAIGEDIEIERCPRKYADTSAMLMIGAYREYKNGYLPNAGGWLDQPMKFTYSIAMIESIIQALDEKENG